MEKSDILPLHTKRKLPGSVCFINAHEGPQRLTTTVNHLKVSVLQPNLPCPSQLAEGSKISHFTVMVTNYAKRRVKLRIKKAKFRFVLIVFLQQSSVIVQLSHKKKQWILTKAMTVRIKRTTLSFSSVA